MRLATILSCTAIALLVALSTSTPCYAQGPAKPIPGRPEPVPPLLQGRPPAPEPTTPPARPSHDPRYGVSFTVPPAWNLTPKDGEVTTFNLDARTAAHTAQLPAVATISFNPHPS